MTPAARELLLDELGTRGYRTKSLPPPPGPPGAHVADSGGLDPAELVAVRRESRLRLARYSLMAVVVAQVLFGLLYVAGAQAGDGQPLSDEQMVGLYAPFAVAGVFLLLWWWAKSKPRLALPVGLVIFVGLHGMEVLLDPSQLARGVVMKVLVVGALVYGTVEAWRTREPEEAAEDAFLA